MQFFTYDSWKVEKQYCDAETLSKFSSLDNVFSCRGEKVVSDKTSEVIKLVGKNKAYYLKRYTSSKRQYFSAVRSSYALSEANNLIALAKMGLPVPNVVAHGERRRNGRFLIGALITEAVEDSANLAQHLTRHTELLSDKKWLYSVLDQVAVHTRNMHKHKFVHCDLNMRNVLVQTQGSPVVYFIDCPAGGFKKGYFLKRGIIRDLAHLDKVARYLLSAKDLLRFYKKYRNTDKLTPADKILIFKIRHFHDKHRAKQDGKSSQPYRSL